MSEVCTTVRIASSEPGHKESGGFVEINEADFNPDIHKLFEEKAPKAPKAPKAADPSDSGEGQGNG